MFRHQILHFSIAGFEVKVDVSWLFMALLIAWSLASGFFPMLYVGLPTIVYWWMGLAGVIGLFVSLVFHELCHSLVARRYGLSIRGITLFLFGGIAEMEDEPMTPKIEFLMAIAGPLSSLALAVAFNIFANLFTLLGASESLVGVLGYLASLNVVLAVFNLIPAFPMDGGRIVRSALWHFRRDLVSATVTAAKIGGWFGLILIGGGILLALSGSVGTGIWWSLMGMFLRGAAADSLYQMGARRALRGARVRQFMVADPVSVFPEMTLRELVDDYVFKHLHDVFPVVEAGRPVGLIGVEQIRNVPREQWQTTTVGSAMAAVGPHNVVGTEEDAGKALAKMQRERLGKLLVTDGARLVGVLALKDILTLLSIKMDLEPLG
jgi:Zn-dependent protease/CBS domain-containing protein